MRSLVTLICCAALLALSACDKPGAGETPSAEPPAAEAVVEVAAAGTKFEPAIKAEQLPEGAWYCDMGAVHYAQMEHGDKCPTCGMKLKVRKEGHKPAKADDHPHDHPHGDDHAHDEKGHDHDEKGHDHDEKGHDHEHGDHEH